MSKLGNTNAQRGDSKRVPWYGMIDPQTKDAIRRLASDLELSQSEVVDRAINLLIEVETAMKEESK